MYLSRVSQRNRIHSCMKQGEFWIHGMCFKLIKESDLFDKNKKIKKLIILTRFYVKEIFVFPSPPLRTSYDIISPCVWLTENYRESSRWARRRSRRCSARPTRTETARSGMMIRIVRRPRPGWSTLIGRGPTRLGSLWSRASECCYASNLMP